MMTIEQIKEFALTRKLPLGQAEVEYIQTLVLFLIYEEFGSDLVFKGGTALARAYGLPRFSEDLDFTMTKQKTIIPSLKKLETRFFVSTEISFKEFDQSEQYVLRVLGPLYTGKGQSLCTVRLDISKREEVLNKPRIISIGNFLPELPSFDIIVMTPEEILAEKVRAIMTRDKARDIFDLHYLLLQKTPIVLTLIEKKLSGYDIKFTKREFQQHLNAKRILWDTDLSRLVKSYPSFKDVIRFILACIPL